jgi:Tfp pilus assembly protein PilF
LGGLADRAGNLTEAERHFAAAASSDPASSSARNNYGAILFKLGHPKEAAAQFEASLYLDKNQPNALVNLAQIHLSSGKTDDLRTAEELFSRAYALTPDIEVARALVVIALRLHDREAAAKYFREYLRHLADASNQASAAASRAELGAALLEAGLSKEAIIELNAAVGAEPSNTDAIMRLAKAYLALNDISSAGRTLEAAVAQGLGTAPIYALLASVYEKSGHIEKAIPAMRLAIERDPQAETYRFAYGMLLTSALAPEAAVIRLKEALELFPKSSRLWLALGIAHFKAGRNNEAAGSLTRAVELDPQLAVAFAYLGMTYVEIGRYDAAIRSYENALAVNGKLGVVDFLIADVLLRETTADFARIEAHLTRAVQLEPTFAPARLALGKSYTRSNRLAEAALELEQVVKLEPNLAEAYYQLGRVYTRLKRTAEAQTALATFKRLSDTQKEQALKDRKEIVDRLANVLF